jgi:hypothetical protein
MDPRLKLRKDISSGVSAWLTFEKSAGREGLFSERYLALPISQILANHFEGSVEAECNHPVLSANKKVGRPPQLDFVIRNQKGTSLVVESKWIGATTVKVSDVIWDCVRLELATYHFRCDGLFILAGRKGQIDKTLNSKSFNPKTSRGKPSPVLNLNGHGRFSVNIQSPKKDFGPLLHKTLKMYPNVLFPRSFVCGTGIQTIKNAGPSDYVAAVWHIKPEYNKRFPFSV